MVAMKDHSKSKIDQSTMEQHAQADVYVCLWANARLCTMKYQNHVTTAIDRCTAVVRSMNRMSAVPKVPWSTVQFVVKLWCRDNFIADLAHSHLWLESDLKVSFFIFSFLKFSTLHSMVPKHKSFTAFYLLKWFCQKNSNI